VLTGKSTLAEAKAWLRVQAEAGARCPCCTQHTKIYKRNITSSMALFLLALVRESERDPAAWIHVPTCEFRASGPWAKKAAIRHDWGMLAYWKLIEQSDATPSSGAKTAGLWRTTQAGRDFAKERLKVPKYARVFDGRVLGLDGAHVGIQDALGTKFNYAELMGR